MDARTAEADGRRIAVYYEHPDWFQPLFAELDRRGIASDRLLAQRHRFDPTETRSPYSLIVNRMSPSAYTRGHGGALSYTMQYLAHLREIGANVLNGYDAYRYEFSKARQIGLLHRLGLRHPRAQVINHSNQAPLAAEGLEFPVLVKPNVGGSGARIVAYEHPTQLEEAAQAEKIDLGPTGTALVQEYLPAEAESVVRVEVLNGEFLYAIRLFLTPGEFNLCPADYCEVPSPGVASEAGITDGVSGRGALVEGYSPSDEIVENVKRIARAAHIEVGGVEYLINSRDGEVYYYDINVLSNFVADAPEVVGFDPFPLLVDYIESRAGLSSQPAFTPQAAASF